MNTLLLSCAQRIARKCSNVQRLRVVFIEGGAHSSKIGVQLDLFMFTIEDNRLGYRLTEQVIFGPDQWYGLSVRIYF